VPEYKPLHIIFTDDDEEDFQLFEEALRDINAGNIVEYVRSGKDLIAFLQSHPSPDLIFMDINMPGMNGIECLKELKLNPKYRSLPLIMYTTSNAKNDIDDSFAFGAYMYIHKPSNFESIKKILSEILSTDWRKGLLKENFVRGI
jgi:CheY-like chemotaxis protein